MARITVEDCLEQVENRFHLVRVASKRARQIMNSKEPTLNWDNDKATVLALREIAAGNIKALDRRMRADALRKCEAAVEDRLVAREVYVGQVVGR